MPMIQIIHARGALRPDQKTALLKGVQDAVVAVEGESLRIGGNPLTLKALAALLQGQNPWGV